MKVKRRKRRSTKRTVKRRKRRNPSIALLGNPRRRTYRRRRYRRNPGFGLGKLNLTNTLATGAFAALGAGSALFISNLLKKAIQGSGRTLSVPMSNMVTLAVAVGLSAFLPKMKLGKYAESAATGAVAISMINIATTSLGMQKFFNLSGEDNPELDRIIANLDVSGEDVSLLGQDISLLGLVEDDSSLLGLAETMDGADAEMEMDMDDEDY